MKRQQKVREKIVLVGTPVYTIDQKLGWIRDKLKKAFDLRFHESYLTTNTTGTTEVNFAFISSTGVVLGELGSMFGFKMNDETPVSTDSPFGSRSGMFLASEVVEILSTLMKEYALTFCESALDKEWRDKMAAREYGEKYGFSLYQVYDYCMTEGLEPQKLFGAENNELFTRRAVNDGIRAYRPREYEVK